MLLPRYSHQVIEAHGNRMPGEPEYLTSAKTDMTETWCEPVSKRNRSRNLPLYATTKWPACSEEPTKPQRILPRACDQTDRAISTGQLHALPHFHTQPINVVVFHGSQASPGIEASFPLRCFQRLSHPYLATRRCRWRDNRYTRGTSTPVLSY